MPLFPCTHFYLQITCLPSTVQGLYYMKLAYPSKIYGDDAVLFIWRGKRWWKLREKKLYVNRHFHQFSNIIVTSFMCETLHIDCSSLAKHFHLFVSYAYIDLFI